MNFFEIEKCSLNWNEMKWNEIYILYLRLMVILKLLGLGQCALTSDALP